MKALKGIIVAAVAMVALALHGTTACGQQAGPASLQYTPRPTVSPYVNLFNDPGGYGVYQTLVKPFVNQYDINANQANSINQLQQQLNQVKSSSGLGNAAHIRQTGDAANYMYLSHYYTGTGGRAR